MYTNDALFHLVDHQADWARWWSLKHDKPLGDVWEDAEAHPDNTLEWNPRERNLRLARQTIQFVATNEQPPISLDNRRGAGRDRYGVWYWIDDDNTGIQALSVYENDPITFWTSVEDDDCDPPAIDKSTFRTRDETSEPYALSGLTVTKGHYLVVGVVGEGLLIFDLHRGGPPTLLEWLLPEDDIFTPFDLATTADGGVLILDRDHSRYWILNENFQLVTTVPADETPARAAPFQPKDADAETEPRRVQQVVPLTGYDLPKSDDEGNALDFISIERGANGAVLLLNAPDGAAADVHEYVHQALRTVYDLSYSVASEDGLREQDLHAYDMTYIECVISPQEDVAAHCILLQAVENAHADDEAVTLHLLFVARHDGNQVVAYVLEPETMDIDAQPDYLVLNRWDARALVAVGGQVYFDSNEHWFPLSVFFDCEYARLGTLSSPIDFERRFRAEPHEAYNLVNGMPEQPFDSNIIGCVWHRLIMDAEIPPETAIYIRARATDDAELLAVTPWIDQPMLYRRTGGSELPYYDPYTNRKDDPTLSERHGTWEILLQHIEGRYIQLELTLEGNTRATPEIQALRLWYPRFSYAKAYLPAIYNEDPTSASFTDRFLANYEGLLSNLEDKIVGVYRLMDARSAPAETLDWLAGWLGAVLHPVWEEGRRRFFIRYAHKIYQIRGTVPGIIIALRIFLDDEDTLDETLFDLECLQWSKIRIVEHYLTRHMAGNVHGDPNSEEATGKTVAEAAHRFTVLFPHIDANGEPLNSDKLAMIQRIIELEKPAHTWFETKEYWNMFRVGEARLGLDTRIGNSTFFQPLVLGDAKYPSESFSVFQ